MVPTGSGIPSWKCHERFPILGNSRCNDFHCRTCNHRLLSKDLIEFCFVCVLLPSAPNIFPAVYPSTSQEATDLAASYGLAAKGKKRKKVILHENQRNHLLGWQCRRRLVACEEPWHCFCPKKLGVEGGFFILGFEYCHAPTWRTRSYVPCDDFDPLCGPLA